MANILFFNMSILAKEAKQQTALLCAMGHDVYAFTSYKIFEGVEPSFLPEPQTSPISLIVTNIDVDDLKEGMHILKLRSDFKKKYKLTRLIAFSGLSHEPPLSLKDSEMSDYVFFPFQGLATQLGATRRLKNTQRKTVPLQFDPGVTSRVKKYIGETPDAPGQLFRPKPNTAAEPA